MDGLSLIFGRLKAANGCHTCTNHATVLKWPNLAERSGLLQQLQAATAGGQKLQQVGLLPVAGILAGCLWPDLAGELLWNAEEVVVLKQPRGGVEEQHRAAVAAPALAEAAGCRSNCCSRLQGCISPCCCSPSLGSFMDVQ